MDESDARAGAGGAFLTLCGGILRALRGTRSHRAMVRRLGYGANPVTDWEHGRRFPTAEETLRAAHRVGLDVKGAFERCHPASLREGARGKYDLASWLDAVRGTTPVRQLAARAAKSNALFARQAQSSDVARAA